MPDSERLRYLCYKPMFETWRKQHTGGYPVFEKKKRMYDYINDEVLSNGKIQYLEFGVYRGESIRYFAEINSDADSRFVGFDTFTGLPEDWAGFSRSVKSHAFDTGGETPQTDDVRISFVKGLFQDTLPQFIEEYKPDGQLVIHNDSDIYSSTLYVLTLLNNVISPGSIIIFDEFYSVMHEYRAFIDYCTSYRRKYEVIAATSNYVQVAVRML